MLDTIIDLVKSQFSDTVKNNPEVPSDKKDEVVNTATSSLMDGLKSSFTLDNLSSLTSLFGSSNGLSSNNSLISTLQNTVVSSLAEKVGINKNIANSIASVAIPAILSKFQNKVDDPNESDFNIESLIKSFSGDSNGGGILGTIGSLFGK